MLKLRFKNNKHNAVWLVEPKVTIGRAMGNDLVIDDPETADQHAEILVRHEQLTLVNLAGKAVQVNGEGVEEKAALNINDQLRIGRAELEVVDPKQDQRDTAARRSLENTGWALKANHPALGNRVFPIRQETVVGRSRECDITLAAAHLSRRHVKLVVEDGLLYARDLGSANGTFLNGEKISEARVRRGDELRFDTLAFGVIGPSSEDLDKTTIRPVSAVSPKPQAQPGARPAPAGASRAQRAAKSPAGRPAQPQSRPEKVSTVAKEEGGRSRALWALGLVLALALAAGLAWQQGLLGT